MIHEGLINYAIVESVILQAIQNPSISIRQVRLSISHKNSRLFENIKAFH